MTTDEEEWDNGKQTHWNVFVTRRPDDEDDDSGIIEEVADLDFDVNDYDLAEAVYNACSDWADARNETIL